MKISITVFDADGVCIDAMLFPLDRYEKGMVVDVVRALARDLAAGELEHKGREAASFKVARKE